MATRDDCDSSDADEMDLARRAIAGDKPAFDVLFDRYFARTAWYFRELPQAQAQAAIWEVLEQLFSALDVTAHTPLAERAFRIVKATSRTPQAIAAEEAPRDLRERQG